MTDTLREKLEAAAFNPTGDDRMGKFIPLDVALTILDVHCAGQQERFEEWARLRHPRWILKRNKRPPNFYSGSDVQLAWITWQAAIATITGKE